MVDEYVGTFEFLGWGGWIVMLMGNRGWGVRHFAGCLLMHARKWSTLELHGSFVYKKRVEVFVKLLEGKLRLLKRF